MELCFVVMCFSQDGEKFESIFSVYDDIELANKICNEMNQYESINHPTDDIIYKVSEIDKNKKPFFLH